jgi:hypothetical protein
MEAVRGGLLRWPWLIANSGFSAHELCLGRNPRDADRYMLVTREANKLVAADLIRTAAVDLLGRLSALSEGERDLMLQALEYHQSSLD